MPPLHIGEFGIGRGGLRHPNLWGGDATAEQERELAREIEVGFQGLFYYLSLPPGRSQVRSAVLWVSGTHYDIFGWQSPSYAVPEAASVVRAALRSTVSPAH